MNTLTHTYLATVVRVIDGDSVLVDLDLGFYVRVRLSCRLAGINALEIGQPGGAEAREHLSSMLPTGATVVVESVSVDKYAGRFDGRIQLLGGGDAGAVMVADGYAAAWDGRGRRPSPPWPIPGAG